MGLCCLYKNLVKVTGSYSSKFLRDKESSQFPLNTFYDGEDSGWAPRLTAIKTLKIKVASSFVLTLLAGALVCSIQICVRFIPSLGVFQPEHDCEGIFPSVPCLMCIIGTGLALKSERKDLVGSV